MRFICPAYIILHDLLTLVVFRERLKLWSSSLCNFLQTPVILSHNKHRQRTVSKLLVT